MKTFPPSLLSRLFNPGSELVRLVTRGNKKLNFEASQTSFHRSLEAFHLITLGELLSAAAALWSFDIYKNNSSYFSSARVSFTSRDFRPMNRVIIVIGLIKKKNESSRCNYDGSSRFGAIELSWKFIISKILYFFFAQNKM